MKKLKTWFIYDFIVSINHILRKLHIKCFITFSDLELRRIIFYTGNPEDKNFRIVKSIYLYKK